MQVVCLKSSPWQAGGHSPVLCEVDAVPSVLSACLGTGGVRQMQGLLWGCGVDGACPVDGAGGQCGQCRVRHEALAVGERSGDEVAPDLGLTS